MDTASQIHGSNPALSATNQVSDVTVISSFGGVRIVSLIPALRTGRPTTVFMQRRIPAAFAALAAPPVSFAQFGGTAVSCLATGFALGERDAKREMTDRWSARARLRQVMQIRDSAAVHSNRAAGVCRP